MVEWKNFYIDFEGFLKVKETNINGSDCIKSRLDDVPSISNQPLSVDVIIDWLDRLVEIENNEENNGN